MRLWHAQRPVRAKIQGPPVAVKPAASLRSPAQPRQHLLILMYDLSSRRGQRCYLLTKNTLDLYFLHLRILIIIAGIYSTEITSFFSLKRRNPLFNSLIMTLYAPFVSSLNFHLLQYPVMQKSLVKCQQFNKLF